uniref:tape measure protein n=1 Tax=Paracoccus sp. TRP TaxID=412597 RepID=UPI00130126E0
MAEADAGLELPIGLTEQKFLQQLARIEARSIKAAQRAEAAFKSSNKASERSFKDLERSAGRSLRGMQQLFRVGSGLLAGGVAAQQVRQYMRIADAATQMRNSLRVAGLEGEELSRVYDQLFRSAQRNATPVNSLVDLYSKLALTQKELGVTSEELIHFTDGIAVALRVGGTDAQAASGALLQLSQALGGGVVRAEEFNSILEGTPTIAQAVARGLKEAGGSVAELRKLVNDGKVSSTAWFRAFEAGSEELRRQAETSQVTVGQSFTRLGNSLLTVVGEFDKATDASGKFAQGISDLANGIESFDASGFISEIQRIVDFRRDVT